MDAVAVELGDREAYVDGDQRVTFGEWLTRADLLAAEFLRRGVRRGDVVALMLPPSIDYAVCYAAAAKAGAITTGLNTRIGRREVDAILGQCSPALVVRDASLGMPDVPAGTPVLARSELAAICGDSADGAAARAGPGRRPGRVRAGGHRHDHVDERHHRAAEGRVLRPREPARDLGRRGRHVRPGGPAARRAAVRARRLHGQAVGPA